MDPANKRLHMDASNRINNLNYALDLLTEQLNQNNAGSLSDKVREVESVLTSYGDILQHCVNPEISGRLAIISESMCQLTHSSDSEVANSAKRVNAIMVALSINGEAHVTEKIPSEVLSHILANTTVVDAERLRIVSRAWNTAAPHAQIKMINKNKLALRLALPKLTGVQIIDWLIKNPSCGNLRYADFSELDDIGDVELKKILDNCPKITTLILSKRFRNVLITAEGIHHIATSDASKHLRTLDLSGNNLGFNGIQALTTLNAPNLSTLDLFSVNMDSEGAHALATLIAPKLKTLILSSNPFGAAALLALVKSPLLKHVEVLNLAYCEIGHQGAAFVASLKESNLMNLNLECCRIGNEGVHALANSTVLKHVTELNLDNNGIGDIGARDLVESEMLLNLRKLYLNHNNLTPGGAIPLARSLGQLIRLEIAYNAVYGARNLILQDSKIPDISFG